MLCSSVVLKLAIPLKVQIRFVGVVISFDTISVVSVSGVVSGYVLGHVLLEVLLYVVFVCLCRMDVYVSICLNSVVCCVLCFVISRG